MNLQVSYTFQYCLQISVSLYLSTGTTIIKSSTWFYVLTSYYKANFKFFSILHFLTTLKYQIKSFLKFNVEVFTSCIWLTLLFIYLVSNLPGLRIYLPKGKALPTHVTCGWGFLLIKLRRLGYGAWGCLWPGGLFWSYREKVRVLF